MMEQENEMEKAYFPMFVDISKMKILVVGGGRIAARRIKSLCLFADDIMVVAPEITAELKPLAESDQFRWLQKGYDDCDLKGRDMVLAATNDRALNQHIGMVCRNRKIIVNVADDKNMCDFFFPGIVKKDELVIGITAGGKNHEKVKEIKRKIMEW